MFMDIWKRQNWGDIRMDLIGIIVMVKHADRVWKPIQLVSSDRFN